ncbi:hypothetical protein AB1046_09900 [Promicromonospora sp. Populi]|uniref:PGAP1-like alpha/beta domain-containing protein n=1 Tax=Promicromonospora sp. Populi TaxID=3239420 RepID=UPI0034E2BF2E
MSESMWGQDPEQVRLLAQKLEDGAAELESIRQVATAAVGSFDGWGPVVEYMRDEWGSQHAPVLSQVAESLTSYAQKAKANADAQDEASNTLDGNPFAGVSTQGSSNTDDGGDDDGGGPLGWLGDKAGDLWDAGGDAVDWAGDKADDAAGWLGDRAGDLWDAGKDAAGDVWDAGEDAAGWLGDRGSDALGWLGDRASTIDGAFENVGDAGMQLWDSTGGAILDGEWPRTTEVIASTILLGGAIVGANLTLSTGGMWDPKVFDDGNPYAGDPRPVEGIEQPKVLGDITRSVTDAYEAGDGVVRITTSEGPNGPTAIVSIPGTETWNPLAGSNAMDVTGNLVTAGGGESTMTEAVKLAIENANLPEGTEVMLAGHSQGGMTAAAIAADPAFVAEHNITNLMTFGSPIDSTHVAPGVDVLELQHSGDAVPRLDLGDDRVGPVGGYPENNSSHTTVTMGNPDEQNAWWGNLGVVPALAAEAMTNHDHGNYSDSLDNNSTNPELAAYQQQLIQRGFLGGDSVSAVDVSVGRED